jgi:hypothetical protein
MPVLVSRFPIAFSSAMAPDSLFSIPISSESGNANSLVTAAGSLTELGQKYAYGFST